MKNQGFHFNSVFAKKVLFKVIYKLRYAFLPHPTIRGHNPKQSFRLYVFALRRIEAQNYFPENFHIFQSSKRKIKRFKIFRVILKFVSANPE